MDPDRTPAPNTDAIEAALGELRMPDRIGPYVIVGKLGEGGMGAVYLAEEPDASRRVALKVIKPGMDSREVLRRFGYERATLARMNDDAIAKVYTFGVTEQQLPYFVMEWVDGAPIDEYCEQWRLDLAARLRLLQQVCAGVQHAHERGAVHRDLKPGNVLVARQGDAHRPKIIDFGLARALEPDAERSATANHQALGTVEFMAPEQLVADHPIGIGTHTDVYALGVMLYQLVTGRLPFPDLRRRRPDERVRIVAEQEPPTVGARIAADLAARAADLQVAPRALQRRARRELTWIAARAMHKDPTRRYPSARDLAEDLGRLLAGQAVAAGPDGVSYRLSKFLRRRWLESSAAVVVGMALVVGLVGMLVGAREAQASNARSQLTTARLAQERGNWAQALTALAAAEATGHADPVEVAIGRVLAHVGAFDDRAASDELRRLATLPVAEPQRSRVLLLRGLFANRAADPEAGLDLVRSAQANGDLPMSLHELANYLLADTFDEAWAAIERAAAVDSHDRLVHLAKLSLLFCSGNADEAVRYGAQLRALYPNDPVVAVPEVLRALVHGNPEAAEAAGRVLAPGDEVFGDALQQLAKSARTLAACDDLVVRFVFDRDELDELAHLQLSAQTVALPMFFMRLQASLGREGWQRSLATLGSVVPPCWSRGFRELPRLLRMAISTTTAPPTGAEDDLIRDVVRTAADRTGLGVFRMMSGCLFALRGEHERAVAEYERAATAGALIPMPRSIDRGLLDSSYALWQQADAPARDAHRERALAALRRLLPHARRPAAFLRFLHIAADLDAKGAVADVIVAWHGHPDCGADGDAIDAAIRAEVDRHAGDPIAHILAAMLPR